MDSNGVCFLATAALPTSRVISIPDSTPYGYIYLTTNLVNGKMYVGMKSRSVFVPSYFGSGVAIRRAVKKYGKGNFSVGVLSWEASLPALNSAEVAAISEFRRLYGEKRMYNIEIGGRGGAKGQKRSKKARQRMSLAHIGQVVPEEVRQKISGTMKGRPMSENNAVALRAVNLGKTLSPEHMAKFQAGNLKRDRRISRETRVKIGLVAKARWAAYSPERREQIRVAVKNGLGVYLAKGAAKK